MKLSSAMRPSPLEGLEHDKLREYIDHVQSYARSFSPETKTIAKETSELLGCIDNQQL